MLTSLIRKHSKWLAAASALLALFAAPYLIPTNPDSAVFRSGVLGTLLMLVCAYPAQKAFETHSLRDLVYGSAFALIFAFALGLGSELHVYEQLLPGMGSMLRRFAVPAMATPLLGALASYVFAFEPRRAASSNAPATRRAARIAQQTAPKKRVLWIAFFLLLVLCYGAVLMAFYPGVINYDFSHEYQQFVSGVYNAAHPVFHSMLIGSLYQLGQSLFGTATAGAATYSVVQLVLVAAMFATALRFVQRRVPGSVTLAITLMTALLPFQGVLAISTVKDALFTGLLALLCVCLWAIAEDPDVFLSSLPRQIGFALICLLMALIRHNGIFAFLPACISLFVLCFHRKGRALALIGVTLALCLVIPKGLEFAVGAQKSPSSEMMSIPCQQLMRTAERADLTDEEYAEINEWFSGATHRYQPHYADPAKGGNFALQRFTDDPGAFWSLYFKYAARYPRIYVEAFLENNAGVWYPDDISHAHTMESEDWDFIYLRTGNVTPEELGDVEATSYLPALRNVLFEFTHNAVHEQYPVLSLLMRPAIYSYLLLLALMVLFHRRQKRLALCLLPTCGVALSLLFSACILVRYAYPIMTTAPMLLALAVFAKKGAKA